MSIPRFRATAIGVAIAAVLSVCACGENEEEGGPTMRPGENCLSCHSEFTLAGTVYAADTGQGVAGVDVAVSDSGGVRHYTSNSVGNFFTTDPVTFPIDVSVSRGAGTSTMSGLNSGACNGCHGASMRITVP